MKDYEQIKLEKDGPIAILTLHRPEKMNAFTGKMMYEMIDAFDLTDADDDVRAVIVTGSGERAFCAGADLSEGAKT
ncbi:MAG: enoyl-CoA hydratase-related protein, partial [Pseudomonadota bacterium]